VYYDGAIVEDYFADIIVNDLILVELKTAEGITDTHEAQLMNYLKSTKYEVGLLFNFGPKPKFIRRVLDNEKKGSLDWMAKNPSQQP
jgi:GxxExxY protein